MADARWTPSMVEERLVEAADILKRLPEVRVQGYYSLWPAMFRSFADLVGQEAPRLRRPSPAPDAITRMEETLGWTVGLDPLDAKIVWLRASGERWKVICWQVGLARATAHEHWLYALCAIAWKLNGWKVPNRQSKRYFVTRARESVNVEGMTIDLDQGTTPKH